MSSLLAPFAGALNELRRWLLTKPWFTSTLLPAIPRPVRWMLRRVWFLPSDVAGLGRSGPLPVPPASTIFTGSVDDFVASGEALVSRLVETAGLAPDSVVLDMGSGMGRLALALLPFLGPAGRYEGLDIVPAGVAWCQENITPRRPEFRFTLADIHNSEYNPAGRIAAAAYRFPYEDETFDLVVLASVFTHLLPAETERYVSEIARVLRKGGRCYASYSLIDEASLAAMKDGQATLRFRHRIGPHWIVDPHVPELAVAYEEPYLRDLYARNGLSGSYTVYHGRWAERAPSATPTLPSAQDVIVAVKG
jgi:SAM-dependent methyltransferase